MFQLHNKTKIILSLEPLDLRKSFNGREAVVVNDHNMQLNERAIHLFTKKQKIVLKYSTPMSQESGVPPSRSWSKK
ncbi:MAG: hypothetical protein ACI9E1_001111 [Cryomorphaceae bacterium]|jgi:hypothetical protein